MKLASIETISQIIPHPNADRLDLATILGWQCVVKRGEFQPGDKIIFIYTDTILPDAPWSIFLKDRNKPDSPIRLRTIKLRGEYSSGLVLPITILPDEDQNLPVGSDVASRLGITKYVKPVPAQLAGKVKCEFPNIFVTRTDEDNGLSDPDLVAKVLEEDIIVTLKVDGTSMTCILEEGEISHVCSRNFSLLEDNENTFWQVARSLAIPAGFTGAIQGEVCGPNIQGNQLGLSKPELFVFQIKSAKENRFLSFKEAHDFSVNLLGCQHTQEIPYHGEKSLGELQRFADGLTLAELNFPVPAGSPAEGIVVRPRIPKSYGKGRPLGFKLINRNFLD